MSSQEKISSGSEDFLALCHAQLHSLDCSINMDWAGVYLAQQDIVGKPQLFPAIIYPERGRGASLPPSSIDQGQYLISSQENYLTRRANQIALPLVNQGEILGVLLVVRDQKNWTERELQQISSTAEVLSLARKLDLNYNRSKAEALYLEIEKANQEKYIADLLHQLKNPVTALRTFTKLLIKKITFQGDYEQALKGVVRESERIVELLQSSSANSLNNREVNLLPQASQLKLNNLSLESILIPLIDSFSLVAQEKGLDLSYASTKDLIQVKADSRALTEVMSNLIDNAIKYTSAPGKILITTETQANWVRILVTDNGCGVPLVDQPYIFERHFRGEKTQQEIPGSGLGLAIAKELVEQMQGKIELLSPSHILGGDHREGGGGSTFIVWLLSSTADSCSID
jgi:signal transduction histidine kinase